MEATPPPTTPSPAQRPLNMWAIRLIFAMPVLIVIGYFVASLQVFRQVTTPRDVASLSAPPSGSAVYQKHCANCHGLYGDGRGVAELNPPARHFGFDKFKFASTDNGIPTDDDLKYLLQHGIQGSAMPAFPQLTEAELDAVISHVRQLTRRGLYNRLMKEAQAKYDEGGDEPDPVQIAASVEKRCQVGKPIAIPAKFPEPSDASRANGKRVFMTSCASCHGAEGRGDGAQTKDPKFVNENGTKAIPRDLTAGIYKAGGDESKIYARIMLGIPGTPMPASNNLPPQDVLDLVNYVKWLPQSVKKPESDGQLGGQ